MAAFILLVLVFSCQLIAGLNTQLPPATGNLITILSIDGGGIRGIVPAVVLNQLENALKVNNQLIYFSFFFILSITYTQDTYKAFMYVCLN